MLAVDGVSVVLGGRKILDDVTFEVRAGEFTGLIGSNGSGKTTLLRVILGLQRTTGGPGVHARRLGRTRAPPVGYVPQKVLLDPDVPLRARDLVTLGIDGNRFGLQTAVTGAPRRRRRDADGRRRGALRRLPRGHPLGG